MPRQKNKTNEVSENREDRMHGYIYQLKLLMLFLYRGVLREYSFLLTTELKEAKKFDDLVFEYTEDGRKKYRLLQAKHRLEEKTKKIRLDNLLTESDGDFSLTKYFFSYQDSKKEEYFKDGSIEDVTICTNIDLDFKDLKSQQITIEKIESKDDILDVKIDDGLKQPSRYKFNEDITLLLKPKVQDYNLTRLARRLAECVLKNDSIKHHDKKDIFKSYHLALSEEVIDIKNKKFHDKFIDNEDISEDAKKFRSAFVEEMKRKSKGKLTLENINEAISKKEVIDDNPVGLNLSKNFGKGDDKNWPNNAVSDEGIKDFLDHFVIAVNQPNEEELGEIIEREIGKEFDLDSRMTRNTYNELSRRMSDLLQKKGKNFLSHKEGREFFEEARKGIPGWVNIWFDAKSPVSLFTGRKQELNDLHKKLQRSSGEIKVISQMTSISGLGGIGKTELARQYVHDHSDDYDNNVLWINAESEATLTDSFRRLAQDELSISTKYKDGNKKPMESIVKEVYIFFNKRRSLFIFDNADKSDNLKHFLPLKALSPQDKKPYIVVTSRNQGWDKDIEVLNLNELNLEDAIEFVKKGLSILTDVSQGQDIEKLVKLLQCFPLALHQAVAHIREEREKFKRRGNREYTIGSYIEEYKEKKKELLNSKTFKSLDNDYAKTTFTTWKVTTNKIKGNTEYGQLALKILDIIAYFAPNIIPVEIFFAKLEKDDEKLWGGVELLYQYSMIKLEHGELYVHRLVKEVTRLNVEDREKEILEYALKLFQDGSSQFNLFSDKLRLSNVDHAISVWNYANKHEELVRKFSSLPILIISELRETLRYQEAESFGSNALKLLENILGDNDPSVLSTMNNVANLLSILGKYEDSLNFYRKLKEKSDIINELLTEEDEVRLNFDNLIGSVLLGQGKNDEAFQIFSYLYNLVKEGEILSDGYIENNLAFALLINNEFDVAMEMLQNNLERNLKVLGPDHERTLNTESRIAILLLRQGEYDEALKKYEEVYEKEKRIFGLTHPQTLTTNFLMAVILFRQMQYDEALRIAKEVEKAAEKLFLNHPSILRGKLLIVDILNFQGKYDEALEKCKEVYERRKNSLGSNHYEIMAALEIWGELGLKLAKQGKYDKALEELNEVLEEKKILEPSEYLNIEQTEDAIDKIRRARDSNADFDFDINTSNLLHAAANGCLMFLNELLNKGVDVNKTAFHLTPLQFAVINGHTRVVEKLLEKEVDVDAKTINGESALHLAAYKNNLDVVNALLKRGADVNCYDNKLYTPLHIAARQGHLEVVTELLCKNADANVQTADYHLTPLHLAVQNGHARIVEKLMEKETNADAKNTDGFTALHMALFRNYLDIVKVLLKHGTDVNCYDKTLYRPLHIAAAQGQLEVVTELLCKNADANVQTADIHSTPLHFAAINGHAMVVEKLLEKQVSVNAKNSMGRTALHLAVFKNYLDIVNVLLKEGADVNCYDNELCRPLHNAASEGHKEIVEVLLENGADIEVTVDRGVTPLHLAIRYNHFDVVKILLEEGANVDAVAVADEVGWTPLHFAAQDGLIDIVKLLLRHGADPSIQNCGNKTPLELAIDQFDKNPQIYQNITDILKFKS